MKKNNHPTFAECKDSEVRAILTRWDDSENALCNNFPHLIPLQSSKQIFWLRSNCPAGQQHS